MSKSCLLLMLLLWMPAIEYITGFSYMDEVITLLLGMNASLALFNNKFKWEHNERKAFICIAVFYLLGCVSTVAYNYQDSYFFGFVSGMFSIKAFIAYFGSQAVFGKYVVSTGHLRKFLLWVESMLVLTAILLILDQVLPLWGIGPLFPSSYGRYGLGHCSRFIFTHPTELSCYGIISLILSVSIREKLGLKGKYIWLVLSAAVPVYVAGRMKGIAFLALFVFLRFLLIFARKLKIWHFALAALFSVAVGWKQLSFYFSDALSTARGAMYYTSLIIARDHFPLGAGFGTYGTEFSRMKYSPLYYKYNLSGIYGLSYNRASFAADAMWPGIIGETGIGGLLLMALVIVFILESLYKRFKDNKYHLMLIASPLLFALIESVADSIFMSSRGVIIFVTLAFLMRIFSEKYNEEWNNT